MSFAEELERRDADVAQALSGVEHLQAEIEELRAHAYAARHLIDGLPEWAAAGNRIESVGA